MTGDGMEMQATPLYGVLEWPDDSVADSVMMVIGWDTYTDGRWPVAVGLDGSAGPARTYRHPAGSETDPWIAYYATYREAADVIKMVHPDKVRSGWAS